MRRSTSFLSAIAAALLVLSAVTLAGCNRGGAEGLAIYLTRDDIPPASMGTLDKTALTSVPLISLKDVISYNQQTYELELSTEAFQRIAALNVPVRGKSFVVCVDSRPVYWGAFWTPISSLSFDGVTIWKPYDAEQAPVVTLEIGYPGPSFYSGQDPRNTPEVINSLQKAGKLVPRLSTDNLSSLPHSAKGYELYSWQENGTWHFTLILGTNRNKSLDEIVSAEDFVSRVGWENIHVQGPEKVQKLLGKLPAGEFVIWLADLRDNSAGPPKLELPPTTITNSIRDSALAHGLDFQIISPAGS
jgi:hypothetical protein